MNQTNICKSQIKLASFMRLLRMLHCKRHVLNQQSSRLFLLDRIWISPPPHPQASVSPSPFGCGWGEHTRLRERGWGVPVRTRGQTLWYSRYTVYVLSIWNFWKVVFKYFTQNLNACFSFSPLLKKRWWSPLWQSEQPNIPLRWRSELLPEQVRPFSTSSISEHLIILSTFNYQNKFLKFEYVPL